MNEAESNPNMEGKCPQCGAPLPSGVLAGLCPACLMKQGAAADTAAQPEAAQFEPPGVEQVARLFPQLEILALIGKGGMGAVYRARQPALDRIVALKILPPQAASGPNFVERFNREARALAKLNHPNIVAVYEFGQVSGLSYFIMEYVDGVNLRELERAGKLSPREALQIVPQICEALQFAHDEGIVHRDIKPENILLDKKGRVKIADFGIAKILGGSQADLTGTQAAIGTPHYMAPEQMEKPTAVDHRADIFSLGVVFYEMLTGELPLGKFAPPSSRKVEVDVRLDDVVLRTLEKDPERRYQHASQVKTAVDTIAGTAQPPPHPPQPDAAAMAEQILARDYTLSIRSCVRRGWNLLKGEFWPFVGVTVIVLALLSFATFFGGAAIKYHFQNRNTHGGVEITGTLALLLWGPLVGGLLLYFIRKIRRESATVETAFCGFGRERFLHLFLAGFVTSLLTWLGFLCLVLPGIYLMIAWMFTLPLVADKQLDFWSAMELSRKVVSKHWFKFLGFGIILALLLFAGILTLVFGVFVMMPLIFAAAMYAYDDILGGVTPMPKPAATGPSGTVVVPQAQAQPPRQATPWTPATKIGLAAVALVICGVVAWQFARRVEARHHMRLENPVSRPDSTIAGSSEAEHVPAALPGDEAAAATIGSPPVFGPVRECTLTHLGAIDFTSGNSTSLPPSLSEMKPGRQGDSDVTAWMEDANMDLLFISAESGFYAMTRDFVTLNQGVWDVATPESLAGVLVDSGRDAAANFGAASFASGDAAFPSSTYGFKTRTGVVGLLQITGYSESSRGATIRYKIFQSNTNQELPAVTASKDTAGRLPSRLAAAAGIMGVAAKDQALTAVATDAAKAGEADIVRQAIGRMSNLHARDTATREAALLLARRGLRKEAVDLARDMSNIAQRDQTLAELAQ